MTTICSKCGLDISEEEYYNGKYVLCPHCNWFVPKGSHSYQGRVRKKTRGRRSTIDFPEEDTIMSKGGKKTMVKSKNGSKKDSKKPSAQRTLTCSKCGAVKKAGKKRVAKWKGKTYFCRECRRKMKTEKAKSVKKE